MTEVVAGGAAAEGRSAGAAVDYGGIAGVGRSGGYRQSRRIGTGDPGRGCGFGAGAGFVADAGGDSHLMNSAWIATSQEGRQNVGRIEDRGTQRASRELEDRAAGRLEGEEGGGGGDVGDGVPGQAVVVAVALGDGRRGRRKRNSPRTARKATQSRASAITITTTTAAAASKDATEMVFETMKQDCFLGLAARRCDEESCCCQLACLA
ncbi:hypothetical protein M7I_1381 [Glarea lozoyensis 74030]|uniref:Uncharacterized protein n=1 Tax=Glarea lozoyensis (strain ATCC 74030 / MF5533) TaxID=1104152 RepID=H0EFX3_GLAL7|nr:hypothetical protein M7I_1381 [Glarea lozoyensis 74030]